MAKREVDYATRPQLAAMYWKDRARGRRPAHISTLLARAKERRVAGKAARRANRPIQLHGKGSADTLKLLRRVSRGGRKLSAKEKNVLGPMAMPTARLSGKAGASMWNAFVKSGFRAWETRRQKYGPTGRGKKSSRAKKKK